MNIKKLKTIGRSLTGLKIKSNKKDITCLITDYYKRPLKLIDRHININFKHIDKIFSSKDFYITKQEKKNRYLIALLHEVAHYKQSSKMSLKKWLKGDTDYTISENREDTANRYARRYYKKFI